MPPLKDIRDYIPKTDQTNPNKFDSPEHQRYPLMILSEHGKPYVDAANRPIIVHDAEEEDQFHLDHPDAPRVEEPVNMPDELARLKAENAALKAKQSDDGVTKPADGKPDKGGAAALAQKATADKPKPQPKAPAPGSKLDD